MTEKSSNVLVSEIRWRHADHGSFHIHIGHSAREKKGGSVCVLRAQKKRLALQVEGAGRAGLLRRLLAQIGVAASQGTVQDLQGCREVCSVRGVRGCVGSRTRRCSIVPDEL